MQLDYIGPIYHNDCQCHMMAMYGMLYLYWHAARCQDLTAYRTMPVATAAIVPQHIWDIIVVSHGDMKSLSYQTRIPVSQSL